jgi:hypothetical protein
MLRRLGTHQPGGVIPLRVLLPVQQVVGGFNFQRVAVYGNAAMRGGAEADNPGARA